MVPAARSGHVAGGFQQQQAQCVHTAGPRESSLRKTESELAAHKLPDRLVCAITEIASVTAVAAASAEKIAASAGTIRSKAFAVIRKADRPGRLTAGAASLTGESRNIAASRRAATSLALFTGSGPEANVVTSGAGAGRE